MTDQPTLTDTTIDHNDSDELSAGEQRIITVLEQMGMPWAQPDKHSEGDTVRFTFGRDLTDGERRKLQQRFKAQAVVGKDWLLFKKPISIPPISRLDEEIERLKAQVKLLQDELARERARNTPKTSTLSESIRYGVGSFPRTKDVVAIRRDNIGEHDLTSLLSEGWEYFDSWSDDQYHLFLTHELKSTSGETAVETESVIPQAEASEFSREPATERQIEVIGVPFSFNPVANLLIRNFEALLDSSPLIRAVDEMEADEVLDIMNDELRQNREKRLSQRPAIVRPQSLLLQE